MLAFNRMFAAAVGVLLAQTAISQTVEIPCPLPSDRGVPLTAAFAGDLERFEFHQPGDGPDMRTMLVAWAEGDREMIQLQHGIYNIEYYKVLDGNVREPGTWEIYAYPGMPNGLPAPAPGQSFETIMNIGFEDGTIGERTIYSSFGPARQIEISGCVFEGFDSTLRVTGGETSIVINQVYLSDFGVALMTGWDDPDESLRGDIQFFVTSAALQASRD